MNNIFTKFNKNADYRLSEIKSAKPLTIKKGTTALGLLHMFIVDNRNVCIYVSKISLFAKELSSIQKVISYTDNQIIFETKDNKKYLLKEVLR